MDEWHEREAARENRSPINVPTELVIFIVFGLAYYLTCGLRFSGYGDEAYKTAVYLINNHAYSFSLGRIGIIDSLFAVPFALLGNLGFSDGFAGSLYYVFFSALTCVVFYRFSFEVYGNRQVSILLTLMLGFATQIWVYSKIGMEPVMTFVFFLSVYFVHRSSRLDWLLGGCFLGFTVLTKIYGVMAVPILLVYAYFISPRYWSRMVLILIPSAAGLLTFLAFINLRSGGAFLLAPFTVFSSLSYYFSYPFPFYEGLYAFLLSPGKSIFLFNPPVLLAFFALRRFRLAHKAEFALWLTALAVFLGFFSLIWNGSGDDVWGPRYLTQIIPIVILPAGLIIDQLRRATVGIRRLGICVCLLVALGVFVQVLGLAVPYEWHPVFLRAWGLYSMDLATFTPALSQIVFNFNLLMSFLSRTLTGKSLGFVFLQRTDIFHLPTTLSFDIPDNKLDFPVLATNPLLFYVGLAIVVFLVFVLLKMARNDQTRSKSSNPFWSGPGQFDFEKFGEPARTAQIVPREDQWTPPVPMPLRTVQPEQISQKPPRPRVARRRVNRSVIVALVVLMMIALGMVAFALVSLQKAPSTSQNTTTCTMAAGGAGCQVGRSLYVTRIDQASTQYNGSYVTIIALTITNNGTNPITITTIQFDNTALQNGPPAGGGIGNGFWSSSGNPIANNAISQLIIDVPATSPSSLNGAHTITLVDSSGTSYTFSITISLH